MNKFIFYALGYRTPLSLGKLYHYGTYVEKDTKKAKTYYQEAAKRGDVNAFQQLSILYKEMNREDEAYYHLGIMYEMQNRWSKALSAYKQAAKLLHTDAMCRLGALYQSDKLNSNNQCVIKKNLNVELNLYAIAVKHYSAHAIYLLEQRSDLEPEAAYLFGKIYELGEIGGKKNISAAIQYYEKACRKNHGKAAFRLGALYELGAPGLNAQPVKAIDYYLLAAKQSNTKALVAIEKRVYNIGSEQQQLQLADIYLTTYNKKLLAITCFKTLADKNNADAIKKLNTLIHNDSASAFLLGRMVEGSTHLKNYLQTACQHYNLAMRLGDKQSIATLTRLAMKNNGCAQYSLADGYYHQNKKDRAIRWCILAAEQQKYPGAIERLHSMDLSAEQYFQIALQYDEGEGVKKNRDIAMKFYVKASKKNHKAATFRVGQLYQLNFPPSLVKNHEKSCEYFIKAAKLGHYDALAPLERLSEEVSSEMQGNIGDLYRDTFKNKQKAKQYYKLAFESENDDIEEILTNTMGL